MEVLRSPRRPCSVPHRQTLRLFNGLRALVLSHRVPARDQVAWEVVGAATEEVEVGVRGVCAQAGSLGLPTSHGHRSSRPDPRPRAVVALDHPCRLCPCLDVPRRSSRPIHRSLRRLLHPSQQDWRSRRLVYAQAGFDSNSMCSAQQRTSIFAIQPLTPQLLSSGGCDSGDVNLSVLLAAATKHQPLQRNRQTRSVKRSFDVQKRSSSLLLFNHRVNQGIRHGRKLLGALVHMRLILNWEVGVHDLVITNHQPATPHAAYASSPLNVNTGCSPASSTET